MFLDEPPKPQPQPSFLALRGGWGGSRVLGCVPFYCNLRPPSNAPVRKGGSGFAGCRAKVLGVFCLGIFQGAGLRIWAWVLEVRIFVVSCDTVLRVHV